MIGADDEDAADGRPDLFADLFFGLGALCILAIMLVAPTLGLAGAAARSAAADLSQRLESATFTIDGEPVETLLAGPTGLAVGPERRRIPADAIADDADLRRILAGAAAADGRGLLLVIEPGGEEAAFAVEPVIARHGPPTLRQIRADRACGFARGGALRDLCGRGTGERP